MSVSLTLVVGPGNIEPDTSLQQCVYLWGLSNLCGSILSVMRQELLMCARRVEYPSEELDLEYL